MSEPIIPRYDPLPPKRRDRRKIAPTDEGGARRSVRRRDPRLPWWRARLSWRFGVRQLYFLCLQLQSYIEAGFPIVESWRMMSMSTDHPRVRRLCRAVHADLVDGKPLREALQRHEGKLPRFFIRLMTAAERSGSYGEVLRTLQRHYAWLFEIKAEIIRALTYLLANLLLAKVVFLIRDFILVGIAQSPDKTVAWPAEPIVTFLLMTWLTFKPVLIAIILAYLLTSLLQEHRRLRFPLDLLGLSLPGIGGVIRRYSISNFCRMHATLTASGMHPSGVYRDAATSMGNIPLEMRILRWQRFVDDGEPVHEALRRAQVLTPDVLAIFETSDLTSSHGDVLPRMADLMADQTRHQMKAIIRGMMPFTPFIIAIAFFGFAPMGLYHLFDVLIFIIFFLIFLI
ncbi:type II secretion system F family protein [Candidatus Sumerlaeota bacterium]|nr:type II secretion system F family protein [Candidatus Sumerlaeota bacterium]